MRVSENNDVINGREVQRIVRIEVDELPALCIVLDYDSVVVVVRNFKKF